MIRSITKILVVTLIAAFGIAAAASAAVPPPPVNQNLGIEDTIFNNLVEADCRACHGASPPGTCSGNGNPCTVDADCIPAGQTCNIVPVDTTYLPNRHHLNVGTTVPVGACADTTNSCQVDSDCNVCTDNSTPCATDGDCPVGETCTTGENYCVGESDRPYPSGDTAGNYDCYSCHALVWDGSAFVLEVFRDCTVCHKVEFQPDHPDRAQGLNQHHRTAVARSGECSWCHGAFVQDGVLDTDGDGFADKRACDGTVSIPGQCDWIPTYQPSLVTPWPSGKNFGRCDETCDPVTFACSISGEGCTTAADCPDPVNETCDPVTYACSVGGQDCTLDPTICGGSDTQCVVDADCSIPGEVCNLDLIGGGGGMANARGTEQGNCNYCHDSTSTDTCDELTGFCVVAEATACEKDADCNGPILINHDTHHFTGATGLVPAGGACVLCHGGLGSNRTPSHTAYDIRGCEKCHGFPSLHNIQADSNADDMILPNGEDPWYGHIGSNNDCNGCHGFSVASAPGTGAVIPYITSADDLTATAGTDATVTLSGAALTNSIDTGSELIELASNAELIAADGSVVSITPDSVTQSEMVVTLSGLSAGNYSLRAVKGTNASNPVVVAVTDPVTLSATDCNRKQGMLTIDGSGFGTKPEGTDDYINVQVDGQTVDILNWSPTQIRASVASCSKKATITVNALYGSASSADSGGGGKPDKPCRGKKC